MPKTTYSIVFLAVLLTLSSCLNKGKKYFLKGKIEFEQDNFDFAAENMKQAVAYGVPEKEAAFYIAESYRMSNRMEQAAKYYKIALDNGDQDENTLFYYAYALKATGNYAGAEAQFKKYLKVGSNFDYIQRAKKEVRNLEYLKKLAYKKPKYDVVNCKELNTEFIEYSPRVYNNDFYFTSSRGEGPMFPGQGTRYTDIFEYKFDGVTPFSGFAEPLDENINQAKTHEATCTFSPDGTTIIFSRSNSGKKNDPTQEVDLFQSEMVNGEWTKPERLDFCETYAWDSNPFLTKDGKRLYFASNRDGGEGNDDIWFVEKDEFNEWGDPQNAGPMINTAGAEQFPYETDNGTFYFASDGHPSFGGLDLFKVVYKENGKISIRNLGKPLNSNGDDFDVFFTSDTTGFFASNRKGGVGDDDIYTFNYTFKPHYILNATVYGKKVINSEAQQEILPNSQVVLMDQDNQVIDVGVSDSLAVVKFFIEAEKDYYIKAIKDGYITRQEEFSTVGKGISKKRLEMMEKDMVFKQTIILDQNIANGLIAFPPIYYKYNKWDITKASEVILDEMVIVLKDNPTILVELGSHTDARGTEKYNDILSQKRAESAVNYIIDNGISEDRIVARGYGERQPITITKDTLIFTAGTQMTDIYLDSIKTVDSLSCEVGHQLNRRTEFKIVGSITDNSNAIELIKEGLKEEVIDEEVLEHEEEVIDKHLMQEEQVK